MLVTTPPTTVAVAVAAEDVKFAAAILTVGAVTYPAPLVIVTPVTMLLSTVAVAVACDLAGAAMVIAVGLESALVVVLAGIVIAIEITFPAVAPVPMVTPASAAADSKHMRKSASKKKTLNSPGAYDPWSPDHANEDPDRKAAGGGY